MISYSFLLQLCFNFFSFYSFAADNCEHYLEPESFVTKKVMWKANKNYDQGQYNKAIVNLKSILAHDEDDVIALSLLSRSYFSLGFLKGAEKHQKKVLLKETDYREASYLAMAQIFIAKSKDDLADVFLSAVLKVNPKNPFALGLMVRKLLNQNKLEEAEPYLDQKGLLDPNELNYLSLESEFNFRAKNFVEALKFANQLVKFKDHKPEANQTRIPKAYRVSLLLKAKILAQIPDQAIDALKILDEYQSHINYSQSWVSLLKAEILFKLERFGESKNILIEILKYSEQVDLLVIAALIRIENKGFKVPSTTLLQDIFKKLTHEEILEVVTLSKQDDWDYLPGHIHNRPPGSLVLNNFWFGLNNLPVHTNKY